MRERISPRWPGNPWHLKQAVRILHEGGIIAYPTEAVFGFGCHPDYRVAVLRLLALKQRPINRGLILIASHPRQLRPFIQVLDTATKQRVLATWPGPVTWLLPARANTPVWIRGDHTTIAVRVTAHPIAAALCEAAGTALISTSANLSGRAPAGTALAVRRSFQNQIDYIVPGKTGDLRNPTQIRDALTGRIIRST